MKSIINSVLNTKDEDKIILLESIMADVELNNKDKEILSYLVGAFNKYDVTPSYEMLLQEFPECEAILQNAKTFENNDDLEFYAKKFVHSKKALKTSMDIMDIASRVQEKGLKPEDLEKLQDMVDIDDVDLRKESYDFTSYRDIYKAQKNRPKGLVTGVSEVDALIRGCNKGTCSTIFAYTSQGKSLWGTNIMANNSYNGGYNCCILSFEISKELVLYNLLCKHSTLEKFSKFDYIPHEDIRYGTLTDEQEEYLFTTVLDDFVEQSQGKLYILDETDFVNMSYSEIRSVLYKVDDYMLQQTGRGLDAILIDHLGLMKFTDNKRSNNEYEIINDYVSFFRRLTLKFRKDKETGDYRQLSTIFLAQANRKGYEEACKKEGVYTMLAIAEANEIERASYRIMSIWTNDLLKEAKECCICLLKNRGGATRQDFPITGYFDGAKYLFGDLGNSAPEVYDVSMGNIEGLSVDDLNDEDFGLL